jgi:hypothetical protein
MLDVPGQDARRAVLCEAHTYIRQAWQGSAVILLASNLIGHIREEAKKCGYHAAALKLIGESSKFQALMPSGEYAAVHMFEEAFDHHVDFVMMVAAGEVSANTAKKPLFRT